MMPPRLIAAMQPDHVDMCAHLLGQIPLFAEYGLTAAGAVEMLHGGLADPHSTLLVSLDEDAQAVEGFAWFVTKAAFARSGYLRLIAVHPSAHGNGVGRALLEQIEAQHLSPAGIVLLTSSHNHSAQRFYETLGYQKVGLLPDYVKPGLHECIYFKPACRQA